MKIVNWIFKQVNIILWSLYWLLFQKLGINLSNINTAEHWDAKYLKSNYKNRYTEEIFDGIQKYLKGRRILDIGCGDGSITKKFNHLGYNIYGTDLSIVGLSKAKKKINSDTLVCSDVMNLPFKKNTFDFIVCTEVLEHLDCPDKAILQIVEVAKNNGRIFFSFPQPSFLRCREHVQNFKLSDFKKLVDLYNLLECGKLTKTHNYGVVELRRVKNVI